MDNTEFDYLTSIEKILIERGYSRFKYDHKKEEWVQMKLKGDPSYYFSSMGNLHFVYRKDKIQFQVGLHEKHAPPMLFNTNVIVKFKDGPRMLHVCKAKAVERMLKQIGELEFINAIENFWIVDFDMRKCEKEISEELK